MTFPFVMVHSKRWKLNVYVYIQFSVIEILGTEAKWVTENCDRTNTHTTQTILVSGQVMNYWKPSNISTVHQSFYLVCEIY